MTNDIKDEDFIILHTQYINVENVVMGIKCNNDNEAKALKQQILSWKKDSDFYKEVADARKEVVEKLEQKVKQLEEEKSELQKKYNIFGSVVSRLQKEIFDLETSGWKLSMRGL